MPKARTYYDTHEAADLLGFEEQTLRKWRCRGKGPPWYDVEGSVRYDKTEVKAWLRRRRRPPVKTKTENIAVVLQAPAI